MAKKKNTAYDIVTDTIVKALEEGVVPWQKPWRTAGLLHQNGDSHRSYRGINQLLLDLAAMRGGYEATDWYTFKQVMKHGGNVEGEKSHLVTFFTTYDKETGKTLPNGEPEKETRWTFRYYRVFNAEQAGIEWQRPAVTEEIDPIAEGERILKDMPQAPEIILRTSNRAYYSPAKDHVVLPLLEQFETGQAFYRTAYHELAHSTGHSSRLDRGLDKELNSFGSDPYAKEELIAEITAAMVCHVTGISQDHKESASYCDNWASVLKGDSKLIVQASSAAQKAADWITGTDWPGKEQSQDETGQEES